MQPGHVRVLSQISHIIVSKGGQHDSCSLRGGPRTTSTVVEFRIWTLNWDTTDSAADVTAVAVHAEAYGTWGTKLLKLETSMEDTRERGTICGSEAEHSVIDDRLMPKVPPGPPPT